MKRLSERDQQRLDRITAEWDTGGWTQYHDSEPMAGRLSRGSIEHAVFESHPVAVGEGGICTRRALCGRNRSRFWRRFTRPFDDVEMPRAGNPCAVCLRLIGPFREWQANRASASGLMEVGKEPTDG